MKVFICGQRSFGLAVLKRLLADGHKIVGIAPPPQGRLKDKMVGYALAQKIPIISDCDRLTAAVVPDETELVISAHSHWIISQKIVDKCRFGGIGFHPSLLPLHRGRDAVRWAVYMGDRVTGATVYALNDKCDGGDIVLQRLHFIKPGIDYHKLWAELFPVGVDMMSEAVRLIERGAATYTPQDEACATWEPAWESPRLKRNDLIQIGCG